MKEYLVDVPVKINIWTRPECQKKQFDVIKVARPSILFIVSDAGRNEQEQSVILSNRMYIENSIDWNCKVHKIYLDKNIGMYGIGKVMEEYIWGVVDRCIFLEDDHIPSISFFRYCAELLEKYKDDLRIECICGFNHLGIYENASSDYFFSKQGSIWGFATWKRTWDERHDLIGYNDKYDLSLLKDSIKYNKQIYERIIAYNKQQYYEGHVAWDEFWIDYNVYSQNRLQIIPKCNMISNVGYGENSEHFKKLQNFLVALMNTKAYEINFPMKHPKCVMPDENYEVLRNNALGVNRSLLKKVFDHLIVFDFKFFYNKFKCLFCPNLKAET